MSHVETDKENCVSNIHIHHRSYLGLSMRLYGINFRHSNSIPGSLPQALDFGDTSSPSLFY